VGRFSFGSIGWFHPPPPHPSGVPSPTTPPERGSIPHHPTGAGLKSKMGPPKVTHFKRNNRCYSSSKLGNKLSRKILSFTE